MFKGLESIRWPAVRAASDGEDYESALLPLSLGFSKFPKYLR